METTIANLKASEARGQAVIAELKEKVAELDAKGVRFQTTTCGGDGKTKGRLCVEIDPGAPAYSAQNGKQYRVPLGF